MKTVMSFIFPNYFGKW